MLNEKQLGFFLISAFEQLKAHDAKLNSVMAEVASVRDALNEIGPRYDEVLSRHRKKYLEEMQPTIDAHLQQFDELILRLKSDLF